MTEILNIKKITSIAKKEREKSEAKRKGTNTLERSPMTDVAQISKNAPAKSISKTTKTVKDLTLATSQKLALVEKEKILTDEVLYFLQPKTDAKGNKSFTNAQIRILNSAENKIKFFKNISNELANDAEKYGEEILEDMKDIFGKDEGFGNYLVLRKKDAVSIYNKLIKEFKNDRIKSDVHNIFAKKLYNKRYSMLDDDEKELTKLIIQDGGVKLDTKDYKIIEEAFKSDPKDYIAQSMYSKTFNLLNKEEKNAVKNAVFEVPEKYNFNATSKQSRQEAFNYVRDLVGIRLILPAGSRSEMAKLERYIDKAVASGKMKITRMSNYHANHILPYVKKEKALMWKESIPGMELVETAEVRKRNGYTTTQINLEHKVKNKEKPILVEFQIRTEALNYIGQIEHLIYDILEKKNIGKNIPQLEQYYDSIGIVNAVKDVFNDAAKEEKYTDYERAYYSYVRNKETGSPVTMKKPLLAEFELGEYQHLLSFDALEMIDNEAKEIKDTFAPKQKLPNKRTHKK